MRPLLTLALLAACAPAATFAQQPARPKPALVVFIAVDQMRPDYFERWPGQLTGGLKRLYETGAFYAQGQQDHAITETAPGHSTMLSGRSPASTGVVTNELGVPIRRCRSSACRDLAHRPGGSTGRCSTTG
jgi:predicted AlkP superfamily pyrophosphatase or phosphodiesterase